jgi:hypothetical protein
MEIGTVRHEEARVWDSHEGYHSFHAEYTQEEYGSFCVFWDNDTCGVANGPGWYWWACFPGCIPDGDAIGPFASSRAAHRNADEWAPEYDAEFEN